jgi:hypothetical protein
LWKRFFDEFVPALKSAFRKNHNHNGSQKDVRRADFIGEVEIPFHVGGLGLMNNLGYRLAWHSNEHPAEPIRGHWSPPHLATRGA